MYVKWKFGGQTIFSYNGAKHLLDSHVNFSSATIIPENLLRGIASLKMNVSDAVIGNYTCEVTELSREGETIIELKYRIGKIPIKAFFLFVL